MLECFNTILRLCLFVAFIDFFIFLYVCQNWRRVGYNARINVPLWKCVFLVITIFWEKLKKKRLFFIYVNNKYDSHFNQYHQHEHLISKLQWQRVFIMINYTIGITFLQNNNTQVVISMPENLLRSKINNIS